MYFHNKRKYFHEDSCAVCIADKQHRRNQRKKALIIIVVLSVLAFLAFSKAFGQWSAGVNKLDTFVGYIQNSERVQFTFKNGDTFAYEGERLRDIKKELENKMKCK